MLHFESIGRGRPIILLHGWINSWDVWRQSMLTLAEGNKNANGKPRRVFALDFWGFGDSSKTNKNNTRSFQLDNYVEMVRGFMDNMGIIKAPIAGHSMGGTVALQFALKYPERVEKVVIVGSPIVGSSLNPFPETGRLWLGCLVGMAFAPFTFFNYAHSISRGF